MNKLFGNYIDLPTICQLRLDLVGKFSFSIGFEHVAIVLQKYPFLTFNMVRWTVIVFHQKKYPTIVIHTLHLVSNHYEIRWWVVNEKEKRLDDNLKSENIDPLQ